MLRESVALRANAYVYACLFEKESKQNERNHKDSIKEIKFNIYKDCSHNNLKKQEINIIVQFDDHEVYLWSNNKKGLSKIDYKRKFMKINQNGPVGMSKKQMTKSTVFKSEIFAKPQE